MLRLFRRVAMLLRPWLRLSIAIAALSGARAARADSLPAALVTIAVPTPAADAFSTSLRFGADGLLYAWNGATVSRQSAPGASVFQPIGAISTSGSDAGPLNFSQNSQVLLIGDGAGGYDPNSNGLLFTMSADGGSATPAGTVTFHQDFIPVPAASTMATSQNKFFIDRGFDFSGAASEVDVFDFSASTTTPVIENIPGAATSVAIDSQNRLYVGVGYGADQGQIRRFNLSAVDAAFSGSALDWSSGQLVNSADNNSGLGMFFDSRGLLFTGGPDGLTVLDDQGHSWFYSTGPNSFPSVTYNAKTDQFALFTYGANPMIFNAGQFAGPPGGAWSQATSGGVWSAATNWAGSAIAGGTGVAADFSQLTLAANNTVHLDSPRTVGNLVFGDLGKQYNWTLDTAGFAPSALTLAVLSRTPTIEVVNGTATISAALIANQGFTKGGAGTLSIGAAPTFGTGASLEVASGTLRFNVGSGSATIGAGVTAAIDSGATLDLAGSVAALNSSVNVTNYPGAPGPTGGGLVVSGTQQQAGRITGSGNMVVAAGASIAVRQIVQNSLAIHGTGTGVPSSVALIPSGSGSTSNPTGPNDTSYNSTLTALSIDNNFQPPGPARVYFGTLDIGNNGLVIAYGNGADPFATIVDMVRSGYANGHWNGTGITSSVAQAAADSSTPLNIGLLDFTPEQHGDPASIVFEGQTITTNAVLLRLTYMDDLVLAGDMAQANATSDALFFAANYGSGTTWGVGDLTHDGVIDTNDALLFAANYVVGLPSLDGGSGAALANETVAAPEPSTAALAVCGAMVMAIVRCWLTAFSGSCATRLTDTEN